MNNISVIIPVYNAESTIEKCISSIINQTKQVYEIVIVNDGSTDNSDQIINNMLKTYEKIKYYSKENTGVADTRNYGINKATGDYILFVDADDYIEENLIETVSEYINQGIELIKFKLKRVDNSGNVIEKVDGPTFSCITGEEAFNQMYYQDLLLDSPCVYVIKKELFTKNSFAFKGKYHEDFGLIPLILATSKTVVSLPNYFYTYIQGENSITRNEDYNKTIEKMQCVLFQYDNMLETIEHLKLSEETKKNIKLYYTNAITIKLNELKQKEKNQFIKEIKKRKMYQNIKTTNIKQKIKRILLKYNINLYLKIR